MRVTSLAAGEDVQSFALTPDGLGACCRISVAVGPTELYRVALDGSSPRERLSGPMTSGGNVTSFALSPDGAFLVYRADERVDERYELFSVPLAGGAALALDNLPDFGDVNVFRVSPDSRFALYRADRDSDGVFELFVAPLDAGAPARRVNNALVPGGRVETNFQALAGGRALFLADQRIDETFELYLGPLEHGPLRAPPP